MAVNIRNDRPHEVSFSEHLGGAVSKKNVVKPGDTGQTPAEELRFESAAVPASNRGQPDAGVERSRAVAAQDTAGGVDSTVRVSDTEGSEAYVEFAAAEGAEAQRITPAGAAATAANLVFTQAHGVRDEPGRDAGSGDAHRVHLEGEAGDAHRVHADATGHDAHREAIDGAAGHAANVVHVAAGEASGDNVQVVPGTPTAPHIEFVPPPDGPVAATDGDDRAAVRPTVPQVARPMTPKVGAAAASRSAFAGISVAVSAELRERVGTLRGETDDLVRKLEGMEQRLNRKPGAGRT